MDHNIALTELGMISDHQPSRTNHRCTDDRPADSAAPGAVEAPPAGGEMAADRFREADGLRFAGSHVILDFWGARRLDDQEHVKTALRMAAEEAGATVLHVHVHQFGDGGGVSGVAVLAESHISIHTWPEHEYAALDVFMCGDCRPLTTLPVLRRAFSPRSVQIGDFKRGLMA